MDPKKNKIIAKARECAEKGKLEKALAEYRKAIGNDEPEIQTAIEMIDVLIRMGKDRDAVDTSLQFAKRFATRGYHVKAVTVCKKALEIDPSSLETREYLVMSYLDLGLTSEALVLLEQLADTYENAGRTEKLIQALNQMIEIDPSNTVVRMRIAEHLSKNNRSAEAIQHLWIAAKELKRQKRSEEFLKAAERIMGSDPGRIDVAKDAAEVYIEQKDYKRALAMLQRCFSVNPRDINTLEMLATAFIGIDQADKAVSVYKQICVILRESNNEEMRKAYLETILDIDPENEFARTELRITKQTSKGS